MSESRFTIAPAREPSDYEAVRALFQAYTDSLGVDLAYQGFAEELASLPGKYAPPRGDILLARTTNGRPVGCVAVRPLSDDVCEMKRLFVSPSGRGFGLGRALIRAVVDTAKRIGYREMRLDTLPTLEAAVALYLSEGFVNIPAYYDTPLEETRFMAKILGDGGDPNLCQ